jgi:CheY-like chemotaxis protein
MGIPKEIQDKIFDPFFTTKELGKGTGLGLSTTLTIVKSHGGFIHCHSAPGKGSVFEIYLPANATLVAVETAPAEESRLPRGHNELVLVVDDEEPIRRIAQKTLERYGYRVLLAADGAEAVSLYAPRQQEIGAVITDMMMPIMDGPATIIALIAINSDVKIVSSSGLASDGGMTKARNAGVRYFIPKPYTAETMLNTLHEVLHGKSENNHS